VKFRLVVRRLYLSFCSSQVFENLQSTDSTIDNQYGVSVDNGTLKFSTFEKYHQVLEMTPAEKATFLNFAENLSGFTSNHELLTIRSTDNANASGQKPTTSCNCPIDDEYINSIIDADHMLIISNFSVKLNACNNMMYASDELAPNAAARRQALINCDFSRNDFYVYTFEHLVEEELQIVRDSLTGVPNARGGRCKDNPCGNRFSSLGTTTLTVNGVAWTIPPFNISYTNWGVSGTLRADIPTGSMNGSWPWRFEYTPAHYKYRCGSTVNHSPFSVVGNWNGQTWRHIESIGTRITNVGQFKVRVKHANNASILTPYINIVF